MPDASSNREGSQTGGGACWAAVYGVAQSWTRLKSLSSSSQYRRCKRHGFDPWVWKIPSRREWQPTPVLLPGEFHGQRSLVGYSHGTAKSQIQTEWLNTMVNHKQAVTMTPSCRFKEQSLGTSQASSSHFILSGAPGTWCLQHEMQSRRH